MPLGQGWLNAWIKVNNKHVVFPASNHNNREASSSKPHKSTTRTVGSLSSVATTSFSEDHNINNRSPSRKGRRRSSHHRTDSFRDQNTDTTSNGQAKAKRQLDALNNQDAGSTSDKGKHLARSQQPQSHIEATNTYSRQADDRTIASNDTEEPSSRFVANFFGADIGAMNDSIRCSTEGGHYLPSATKQGAASSVHGRVRCSDAISVASRGNQSLPSNPTPTTARTSVAKQTDHTKPMVSFLPNLFTNDNHSKAGPCATCQRYETELTKMREDIEYLRSVKIESEYTCARCANDKSPTTSVETLASCRRPGHQTEWLKEVIARHKAQTEQLTKERQRWHHDTNVKLQKFASLCRDLNEEATIRNEEALKLHEQVETITSERNSLATELEKARAIVATYQQNETQRENAERRIRIYEQEGLNGAQKAITLRDGIISDLSGRLEQALECLDIEREQRRQRRHIFPPQQKPSACSQGDDCDASEVKRLEAALQQCEAERDTSRDELHQRELQWEMERDQLTKALERKSV